MKKTFLLFATLLLIGAGCTNPFQPKAAPTDTFGQSRFGTALALGGAGAPKGPFIEGGWVRPFPGPFWWDAIETAPGQFDWTLADQEVQFWNAQNQAMLVTLWPFAEWDQKTCHGTEPKVQDPFYDQQVWLSSVCNVEAFERFVTAVVERYDGDGTDDMPGLTHGVNDWEIGHEPDVQTTDVSYFQSGPFAYAEIFQIADRAISTADPNARVLPAGQSSMMPSGTSFFRQVLTFARSSIRMANIHSNSSDEGFYAKDYRDFLNGLGMNKVPFWITRAVVGSPDPLVPWSEDEMARMTFVGYVKAFGNGAERIFGTDEAPKKAAQTFTLMAETIGFFDQAEKINESTVLFTIDDRSVFALWNDAVLPGDYKDKNVEILRYDGSRDNVDASTLKADVPMFVFVD